jgi:hypothetical protein
MRQPERLTIDELGGQRSKRRRRKPASHEEVELQSSQYHQYKGGEWQEQQQQQQQQPSNPPTIGSNPPPALKRTAGTSSVPSSTSPHYLRSTPMAHTPKNKSPSVPTELPLVVLELEPVEPAELVSSNVGGSTATKLPAAGQVAEGASVEWVASFILHANRFE